MSESPSMPVLGRVPSGIFILTIRDGERETGMLASWVQQAGFDPPTVTVAVKSGRYVEQWITAGREFALCLLAEDQKAMLGHFGRGFEPDEPAFEGLDLSRSASGLPVLDRAIGYLECQPKTHLDSGDHRIFLAQVVDDRLLHDEPPMVHVRKSGLRY